MTLAERCQAMGFVPDSLVGVIRASTIVIALGNTMPVPTIGRVMVPIHRLLKLFEDATETFRVVPWFLRLPPLVDQQALDDEQTVGNVQVADWAERLPPVAVFQSPPKLRRVGERSEGTAEAPGQQKLTAFFK
eukprot:7961620-Pyramimonas_sp.AAC.1